MKKRSKSKAQKPMPETSAVTSSNGLLRPPADDPKVKRPRTRNTLTKPVIPANGYHYKQNQILHSTIDEVETELSMSTYDRMGNDPTIAKDIMILISNVLSDDLQMAPGATEAEVSEKEHEIFVYVQEFCERIIKGLQPVDSFRSTLEQLFRNGLTYGHGLGEIEWEYRTDRPTEKPPKEKPTKTAVASLRGWVTSMFGTSKPSMAEKEPDVTQNKAVLQNKQTTRLLPKSIKVKPRGAARFVVDDYMNVIGFVPKSRPLKGGNGIKLKWNEVIDPRKFCVLTLKKKNEDPRGSSVLRPAYNWYNLKVQLPAEMLRFILEEIVPKGVATLPPNPGQPVPKINPETQEVEVDENGHPIMVTQAASFIQVIEGFRGGAHAVIPNEAKLEPYRKGLTGSNDANLFKNILKLLDDQMENSILCQTMAQSEGENQGRSASEQVAQILYVLQFWYRLHIVQFIKSQILAPAITINLGEWALQYLPQISLGDFSRRDWMLELEAYADAYFKGLLDDTQRPEIMHLLNLPKPGKSRQELQLEQGAKLDVNGNPVQNNPSRPDKQEGSKGRNNGNGTEKKTRR